MRILVGVLLLVHGLITAAQARGAFRPKVDAANPDWMSWWPVPMGRSWMIERLGREKSSLGNLAGTLWLVAGLCLMVAAIAVLGSWGWWPTFAGVGAAISLVLFVPYAHPLYAVGIGANLAILIWLLLVGWPSLAHYS
jgi:hypothetical protein